MMGIHHLVQEVGCRKAFVESKFDIQSADVTLKMRQRSPKSNHFFPLSQMCFYARLVKIDLLAQEIGYSLYSVMTLKLGEGLQKINQIFQLSQWYNT